MHFLGTTFMRNKIDPVVVRRHIGMVFQQPNPFSMSIFDNVAFGLKLNRFKGDMQGEGWSMSLRRAALWDEVKDKLKQAGSPCRADSSSAFASRAPSRQSRPCC